MLKVAVQVMSGMSSSQRLNLEHIICSHNLADITENIRFIGSTQFAPFQARDYMFHSFWLVTFPITSFLCVYVCAADTEQYKIFF